VKGYYYNPCQSMEFWGIHKGEASNGEESRDAEGGGVPTFLYVALSVIAIITIAGLILEMKKSEEEKPQVLICPQCKNRIQPNWDTCPYCKFKLK